jgi:hypothetical protein
MPDPEFVRVRDKQTKHEVSIVRSAYDAEKDSWVLLPKPGADTDGTPFPPKHFRDIAELSNTNKSRHKADSDKE